MMQTDVAQSHHRPMALAEGGRGGGGGVWFPAAAPPLPVDIFQFKGEGAARSLIQEGLLLCC